MSGDGLCKRVELVGEAATAQLGEAIGQRLSPGEAIALSGEMGAGKTCLVRGLARGLGVHEPEEVCSPTYLLVVEHPGPIPLLHVDAYLPEKTRAFLEDGGVDYLAEAGGVVAVEWADRIADLLPPRTLWIRLEPVVVDGRDGRAAQIEDRTGDVFGWLTRLPDRWSAP